MRKQINIDEEHDRILRELAALKGVSESEVVRRAIELLVDAEMDAERERAHVAHEELIAVIQARHEREGIGFTYKFKREDGWPERGSRCDE